MVLFMFNTCCSLKKSRQRKDKEIGRKNKEDTLMTKKCLNTQSLPSSKLVKIDSTRKLVKQKTDKESILISTSSYESTSTQALLHTNSNKERYHDIIASKIPTYIFTYADQEFNNRLINSLTAMIATKFKQINDLQNPAKDDIIMKTEVPVKLPIKASEYDRKVLMRSFIQRRNAIAVHETLVFKEVLSLYITLNNNLWLVEILNKGNTVKNTVKSESDIFSRSPSSTSCLKGPIDS